LWSKVDPSPDGYKTLTLIMGENVLRKLPLLLRPFLPPLRGIHDRSVRLQYIKNHEEA